MPVCVSILNIFVLPSSASVAGLSDDRVKNRRCASVYVFRGTSYRLNAPIFADLRLALVRWSAGVPGTFLSRAVLIVGDSVGAAVCVLITVNSRIVYRSFACGLSCVLRLLADAGITANGIPLTRRSAFMPTGLADTLKPADKSIARRGE